MPLTASLTLSGSGELSKLLDLSTPLDSLTIGSDPFPACMVSFTDGNGNEQAQAWWHDLRTIAAGADDDLDLFGALTGPLGDAFNVVTLRALLLVIKDPAATKYLRVGPKGATGAAQLGFGGVGATQWVEFDKYQLFARAYGGWPITATTADKVRVTNPSAVSIDYAVLAIATTS
jgi:hypothetical protein